ncbi:MAG: TldD/PmbA family protein [candidate division Zixibacteria bacterium]|nr:TldD/PmbA family protein [candidate division Zixibacteria bacterium]
MDTKGRLELAHWVAKTARAVGAADAAVDIYRSRSVEVEFRDGQLDLVKESTQNSLNIDVYVDDRFSGHSTNDLRRDSLGSFIKKAVAMTKYLGKDVFRKLPDPKYYKDIKAIDLKLVDDSYDSVEAAQRVKMARNLQELTAGKSDKIISSTAGYYDGDNESIKVHSNGFEGITQSTVFSVGVQVTIDDGNGGRPTDWDYATTRFLSNIPDAETQAQAAVDRVVAKVGQAKIESGQMDMVVVNRAAGNPLYALYGPMGGRALQQKRSFLEGKLGEKIASDQLTVIDDPFIERGLGSRHYNGEGMAARKRTLIEKGVLKEFLIDCYYGRKLGVDPTGGSTSNVIFTYGDKSLDDLIAGVSKGILVTSFIGGNTNGTTGDFSWGLIGMLIEDGKIVKPVNEMNISGNLEGLWGNLVAVGNDPYLYSSLRRPSFHFKDVQFAGL